MPSVRDLIREGKLRLSTQDALITMSPVMKMKLAQNTDNTEVLVLPADVTKAYLLHGWNIIVANNAGTPCSFANLWYFDYETGEEVTPDGVKLVPNQVNSAKSTITGLSLLTKPGQRVYMNCDNTPESKTIRLYYTEVKA